MCNVQSNVQFQMKDYRFHLRKYFPGCKVRCPDCGRKSFNLYIDSLGEVAFPEDIGWCDHSPARYFQEHPEKRPKGYEDNRTFAIQSLPLKPIEPQPHIFIPQELMMHSLKDYESNALFKYLCMKVGEEKVMNAFQQYNVGTACL